MARNHGITTGTYKKFIIDAGAVYTGFTSLAALGTLLGATRGGSQFAIEQEVKDMDVDGARGPVIGSRRITMVKATLTVNLIEHTLANFKRALVGSTSALVDVNWDAITRDLVIADTDFLTDITIVGQVSGTTDAIAIKIDNAIVDSNFELNFQDKDEGVIGLTFTAHFNPADLETDDDTEPWTIFWPNT